MQTRSSNWLPWGRGVLDLKGFALAGFLAAGSFKADPRLSWVPVDLTVLFAGLTIACVLIQFLKNGLRVHKNLYWMLILFVLFAVPIFWTQWTPYALDKVQRFYSLTFIAAVAPFFLIRTREDLRRFLNALALLGLILSINAAFELITNGGQIDRLTSFDSNTISLGRGAGMAFVWIAVLALEKSIGSIWAIGSLGLLGVVMLGSGSRGPLLAGLIGLLLLCLYHYGRNQKGLLRFVALLLFLGAIFAYGITVAPPSSIERIQETMQGQVDTSAQDRLNAYDLSWNLIQDNPQGIGWAGFATKIDFWGGTDRQYPHDILLEVFLEEGWLGGLYLLGLLAVLVPRSLLKSGSPETRALFAMLVFFLVNSLVSGDLNDNKELFACLALTLRHWSETHGTLQSGASDLRPSPF